MPEGSMNQVASHNLNLNDLAAAIGRVQLKKLPRIVAARRAFVRKLTEGVYERELHALSVTPSLPGAESSYWWLPVKINSERLTCDPGTLRQALAAEGIPVSPMGWNLMPHRMEWFTERKVFGTSDYPWASPLYKGDADREFPCPNALATLETHVSLAIHESWGDEESADILTAFSKVEAAFLREG
jgi:dTDP-4-amino-4,6-dideoxygalactose transaminase